MEAVMNVLDRKRASAAALAVLGLLLCLAGPARAGELLFYSSVPRNLSDVLVKGFEQDNPGTTVKMFQAGTETLLEKIELEIQGRGKPEADVVWIQEQSAMERLVERDHLLAHLPEGHEAIDAVYKDKGGRWIGTFVTHAIFMYGTKTLNETTAPKSWQDLIQPKFRNKLTFANPRVSGTGSAVASALVQNFGWPYLEKLALNKPQIAAGHPPMVSTVIAGERSVGPMLDYSIFEAMAKGQPMGFVFPAEGAVAVPAYAAIVQGTKNQEAARKFVDFFASRKAASLLRERGMYHTRNDAQPPDNWPEIGKVKIIAFDWQRHRTEKDAIKDRFADLMEK
jgi:iron(III) transport system substrate-binding protein